MGSQTFTSTNNNWSIPPGVTQFTTYEVGPGGGSGAAFISTGAGGGGGEFVKKTNWSIPTGVTALTVTVGAVGVGSVGFGNGTAGGDSWVAAGPSALEGVGVGPTAGAVSANNNSVATTAIDTTGMTLIVIALAITHGLTYTFTDSAGNTWIPLTPATTTSNAFGVLLYCMNPTTSATHTFSVSTTGGFPAIGVESFKGLMISPLDQQNGGVQASGTTVQTGSVTPGSPNELIVSMIASNGGTTAPTVDSGMTLTYNHIAAGPNWGIGMAYKIQGATAAAINPTWTYAPTTSCAATIATFKAAVISIAKGGGGGVSNTTGGIAGTGGTGDSLSDGGAGTSAGAGGGGAGDGGAGVAGSGTTGGAGGGGTVTPGGVGGTVGGTTAANYGGGAAGQASGGNGLNGAPGIVVITWVDPILAHPIVVSQAVQRSAFR